jgi:hypothetical protein
MKKVQYITALLAGGLMLALTSCGDNESASVSGVQRHETKVDTGSDGLTVEQRLVERRLKRDNKPGAVKFAYVGAAFTGEIIYQSTVDGKVVSSGKRLSPKTISYSRGTSNGFPIEIGGATHYTNEILSDDGTYGSSIPYLFWFDVDNTYFQQYVTGGTFLTVTDRPIDFQRLKLRVESYVKEHPESLRGEATLEK